MPRLSRFRSSALAAGLLAACLPSQAQPFVLEEATLASVHAAFKAGTLSCQSLVQQYLARIDAYDKTWEFFFANPRGRIVFEPKEIEITAGDDVALAVCLFHCEGTSGGALDFRLTTGLRRQGDEWVIVHEHHSVRTVEERFTDPTTTRAQE